MGLSRKTKKAKAVKLRDQKNSPRTRKTTLMKKKIAARERRAAQSPCTKRIQQKAAQERMRERRAAQSPGTKGLQQTAAQQRMRERRAAQSPRTKEVARKALRERMEKLRTGQSPSTSQKQKEAVKNRVRDIRAKETPETRSKKLDIRRKSYCVKRLQNITNCEKFHEEIEEVADRACDVCWKECFRNQVCSSLEKTSFIDILPNGFPCTFISCHRCLSKLRKKQVPPTAYWNNMSVAPIPEQLNVLSELELRLISRITPFIKVVRLGGRFGQKGFKGQAILFAQAVEEIAEQLPLSVENSGMIIVTETRENVSTIKKYCVDMNKIKNALLWLLVNNYLYKNVRINIPVNNSGENDNESHIVEFEIPVTSILHEVNQPSQTNNYSVVKDGVYILRGSFHQGSDRLQVEARGKQCCACAASAIAYSSTKAVESWVSADMDRILLAGSRYYLECLNSLDHQPQYLACDELLPKLLIANIQYDLDIQVDIIIGIINPSNPEAVPHVFFKSLLDGLANLLQNQTAGIITSQSQYSVAVFHSENSFYLFDSHARGPKGGVARVKGASMMMKFDSLETLTQHLMIVLHVGKSCKDFQYSITCVQILHHLNVNLVRDDVIMDSDGPITDVEQIPDEDEGQEIMVTNLMPIDSVIPDVEDVLSSNLDTNRPTLVKSLTRKTVPPISLLNEERAEELSWVKLFPDGHNGLREKRKIPITPLDYFQSRVMSKDKRFHTNEYLFYALSAVELLKVKENISVCGRLRQDGVQPTSDLIENVHLSMRNIRGTQAYWYKAFSELMAMVKNLGPPHWYMTLSCNDLNWPDILRALLVTDGKPDYKIEDLTFQDKIRLVEEHPVTLSRQFMFRLHAFFRFLKRSDNPILNRKVIDLWWRVEFQLRGSPHVHLVVWCDNMPTFNSPEGIKIIDEVITCHIPVDDNDLKQLVLQVQKHKHTHTCYKQREGNECRFSFPRQVSEQTKVLDDDEAVRNGGRFVILKRSEAEVMINNYNEEILKMWRGNIDIQPCGSALGVAYYIAKYISKSEPRTVAHSISEAIKRVQQKGGAFAQKMFAVQNAILTHRQVSAPECAFRLCHLKLRDSTRKCIFVNTCLPEQRYRILKINSANVEPFKNIFDRYIHRPHNLEHLSLGEFAVRYEPITRKHIVQEEDDQGDADAYDNTADESAVSRGYITLLENMGRMQFRNRAAILRTRYFTPQSDPANYYYSLMVTHIPFRSEASLIEGFNTTKEAFLAKRDLLRPLHADGDAELSARWEDEIQAAITRLITENLVAEISSEQHIQQPAYLDELCFEQNEQDDDTFQPNMTNDEFEKSVKAMNSKQKNLFKKVSEKLISKSKVPLLYFITGGAGSGKSFILKLIVQQVRRLSDQNKQTIAVTAPTGVAARLIGAATLHRVFMLPLDQARQEMRPLTGEKLRQQRLKWRTIEWLIVDEISMVSYTTIRNINIRLQELKQNTLPFGGINVLFFGDLMQLPPVSKTSGKSYCFYQPIHLQGETHLWRLFGFVELDQNMRQAGDTTFIDILNNLRVGKLSMQQLEILDRRRIDLTGQFADGEAVRIFPTTKLVNEYNAQMIERLSRNVHVYTINAFDTSVESKTYGKIPKKEIIPNDPNKCGGMVNQIKIGIGARVMLRRNINVNHGLVNGAMGVVRQFEWPALRRDQLEDGELPTAIFVEFDDTTIPNNIPNKGIRIECISLEYDGLRGAGKIQRRMLPLILCWAVTVHKLQGTTLDKAVVYLGSKIFAKGQAYVAISRVKSLDGLAISELLPTKLLNNPHDGDSFEELERLRTLPAN